MTYFECFIQAFILGIAMSMVIGPISVNFIKKTLSMGVKGAVAVGSGVALGDVTYSIIAALSIAEISGFLSEHESIIKTFSGMFLLYLAYSEFRTNVILDEHTIKSRKFVKIFIQALLLTLSSPLTIGIFIAIFTGIGDENITVQESLSMAAGIITASICWWIILGSILLKIKHKLSQKWIMRLKYVSGTIIGIFGLLMII
jgi:threonine/homoserine/homoserine lactone efflux protein